MSEKPTDQRRARTMPAGQLGLPSSTVSGHASTKRIERFSVEQVAHLTSEYVPVPTWADEPVVKPPGCSSLGRSSGRGFMPQCRSSSMSPDQPEKPGGAACGCVAWGSRDCRDPVHYR